MLESYSRTRCERLYAGRKYNLPSIDIFNDNGTLSEAAGLYVGMDRFDVRAQIEKDLQEAGLMER